MPLAIVASDDLRERVRITRVIASDTSASALSVGSWDELSLALEAAGQVHWVFVSETLSGLTPHALAWIEARCPRVSLLHSEERPVIAHTTLTSLLRRPVSDEEIVLSVRRAKSGSGTHQVSFVPADFLQMIAVSGGSHTLIVSRDGHDVGIIEMREGQVWTAFDAHGKGEEAFARLMAPNLRARARTATQVPKERTVFRSLSELLLDSFRLLDEGKLTEAEPLSEEQKSIALATQEEIAAKIKELQTQALRHLMQRSYDDATRVLMRLAELDPSSSLVQANLEQLRKLGYPR